MSYRPPPGTPLRRRLSFSILAPVLAFAAMLGAALVAYNLYALARFAEVQAATRLHVHAETIRQIVEDYRDPARLLDVRGDARAGRVAALLAIEDFARVNRLLVRVRDPEAPQPVALGESGVALPDELAEDAAGPYFALGERRFRVHRFDLPAWRWQVETASEVRSFAPLRDDLLQGAWAAAAALVAAALLFLLYLVGRLRRPVLDLVDDLAAGRPPRAQGIVEFEFVGDTVARLMRDQREQAQALVRHGAELETRVAERTADLRAANQRLQDALHQVEDSQRQLLQAEKLAAIGQLAAGVAHEINNPIGYVNSNVGTLGDYVRQLLRLVDAYERRLAGTADDTELAALHREIDLDYLRGDIDELFAESLDGLARVRRIVLDLRDFSRVGERDWRRADLHAGLDSTLNIVANELKYKARVVKDYGDLPEVECLPGELNQVFLNLLINAGHAIRGYGEIVVRTRRDGDSAVVEIADNGCGIPPDQLSRIFEPFFTTKPVGQGTGLGLALSYGIVQKHHGRIEVESTVDVGSTFRVLLPLTQPVPAAAG